MSDKISVYVINVAIRYILVSIAVSKTDSVDLLNTTILLLNTKTFINLLYGGGGGGMGEKAVNNIKLNYMFCNRYGNRNTIGEFSR